MSRFAPFYSFDPCVRSGAPCGATFPYSTKNRSSRNDLSPCSVCPGGGCCACPAPVKACPAPPVPPPVLPCLPPCPPCCEPYIKPRGKPCQPCFPPVLPCLPPCRCVCAGCPRYCCPKLACCCLPKRCGYPGVPTCGPCGPCMPIW